ncbi:hypothetical protein HY085_02315 [Candidatus Gottesmanbacteria bacterium]|nr:hypothetical protein [Candidatus Gottesmanbacteria bacterium]
MKYEAICYCNEVLIQFESASLLQSRQDFLRFLNNNYELFRVPLAAHHKQDTRHNTASIERIGASPNERPVTEVGFHGNVDNLVIG